MRTSDAARVISLHQELEGEVEEERRWGAVGHASIRQGTDANNIRILIMLYTGINQECMPSLINCPRV